MCLVPDVDKLFIGQKRHDSFKTLVKKKKETINKEDGHFEIETIHVLDGSLAWLKRVDIKPMLGRSLCSVSSSPSSS